MFRALVVERECGAGGSIIARNAAEKLGWTLLDGALIGAVARESQIDRDLAALYDERVDSWWSRFHRCGLWSLAIDAGVPPNDMWIPSGESIAESARRVISKAAAIGGCVNVGRGAQCVLQQREDVFRVFIYGPWLERVSRVGRRLASSENASESIRRTDDERARYIRTYYGCDWKEPDLYHMMVNSEIGVDDAAATIVGAIRRSERGFYAASRSALPA
jgi:cytidylate kinase